jgi:hypothetical protein
VTKLLPIVLAAALLAPAAAGSRPDSGVRGKVVYGPTCPVERPGESCTRPYRATLRVRKRPSQRLVGTVHSGNDGRFGLRLSPGRYLIVPVSGHPFPRASSVPVRVRAHRFTRVTIAYDSGIR